MMYFSRMKTTLILGACLLGMLLGVPNLFPAPAAWMPWRTVHLGLDLRGGSYLLLEVDMKAVLKERLDSLADGVRQALRGPPDLLSDAGATAGPEPGRCCGCAMRPKPMRPWRRCGR